MKKIIITFSLLCLPVVSVFAGDSCTDKDAYTLDRRCYVTEEQKKVKPYNAVVKVKIGSTTCSGTIVKGDNGNFYVYTAKHCAVKADNVTKYSELGIILQDGREYNVQFSNMGDDTVNRMVFNDDGTVRSSSAVNGGDWAVYKLSGVDNVPFVERGSRNNHSGMISVQIIGYGALKIMSDQDIRDFKQEYKDYLLHYVTKRGGALLTEDDINSDAYRSDLAIKDGLIDSDKSSIDLDMVSSVKYLSGFIELYTSKYELFDQKLKTRYCYMSNSATTSMCQTWAGDSGGGIFNSDHNIVGIHRAGNKIIGGKKHSWSGNEEDANVPIDLIINE